MIVVIEHNLNRYRKQVRLTLWKIKRLLESEYNLIVSEAKISRWLTGVDKPIPEHVENALASIFDAFSKKESK